MLAVLALLVTACGADEPGAEPAVTVTDADPDVTVTTTDAEPAVTATTTGFVDPPPPDGWVVWLDTDYGFNVAYPPAWFRAEATLTPAMSDPFEVVSLATFPVGPEHDMCGPFPMQAVADFPADGAFITVQERIRNVDPGDFMARPRRFGPETVSTALPEGDCLFHTDRGDAGSLRWIWFEDQGRTFEVLVVIGTAVSADTADETWTIVNGLSFAPREPVEPPSSLDLIYAGNVFVIDPGDGPEVCAGSVLESLPPQCGGPFLDGLDWDDVPWAETAQGHTWAGMYIEVRLVDGRLQLVSPPTQIRPVDRQPADFTPPCSAPDGGWVFTPGPGTTEADLNKATAYIQAQPDLSGHWVHHLAPPVEFTPFELVLVATFTGDLKRHEAAIRELWSGPLCVAERPWREADLRAIQDDLGTLNASDWPPSIFWPSSWGVDIMAGTVSFGALIVTPEGQEWFDSRYGPGVVTAYPLLEPVPVISGG